MSSSFDPCAVAPLPCGPDNYLVTPTVVAGIARVCHEANRAFCLGCADLSQLPWDEAEPWQRDSAIRGVEFALTHPDAPASAQHDAWSADMVAAGWTYGDTKDAVAKTHPCLVPFDQLPDYQQAKARLFREIVAALNPARLFDGSAVHDWFGLTYSAYLVLPRLVLQEMPGDWQRRFLGLIREVSQRFGDEALSAQYRVHRVLDRTDRNRDDEDEDDAEIVIPDPLANYRHGRLKPLDRGAAPPA